MPLRASAVARFRAQPSSLYDFYSVLIFDLPCVLVCIHMNLARLGNRARWLIPYDMWLKLNQLSMVPSS